MNNTNTTPLHAQIKDRLHIYKELLLKWAPRLNLVAKSTIDNIENRHFNDSAQIIPFLRLNDTIIDIGSGAGFPGAILAIYGYKVTLLDSDQKKCVFLETVSRETKTYFSVICSRAEDYRPDEGFTKITSRGVASLDKLTSLTQHLAIPGKTRGIFLKGENYQQEISENLKESTLHIAESTTHNLSAILEYKY